MILRSTNYKRNYDKLMNIRIFDQENTILNKFVAQMRDVTTQKNPMLFRSNLHRAAQVMAYEISKTLKYSTIDVETPLGMAPTLLYDNQVVLASILRAGLPMHDGFLSYFDEAENAFVSAYRKYRKDESMEIVMEQVTTPDLVGKTLILIDPMLATGVSIHKAYEALVEKGGKPAHTHIVALISSTDGVEYVRRNMNSADVSIWTAALDNDMTAKSYIVPGIGDTGDLAYGKKL